MTKITVDPETEKTLNGISGSVEIVDSEGRILGYFRRALDPALYKTVPKTTPEELEQLRNQKEWFTIDEVIRHLESL